MPRLARAHSRFRTVPDRRFGRVRTGLVSSSVGHRRGPREARTGVDNGRKLCDAALESASDKVWISLWPADGVSWPPEPMMNWQLGSDGMGAGRMSKRISTREIHERWFYRERDNADEFIRISTRRGACEA